MPRLEEGDRMPLFRYDTPYSAQNRLADLLADRTPLVLVFMNNFGHPITRTFVTRYAQTMSQLTDGGFSLVVRSRADRLAGSIRRDTLPFPLICDADGILYDYLCIPQRAGALTTYSLEGWQIVRAAKKQGYKPPKNALLSLPLTLILDQDGTVRFVHYGSSLTDVPQDCGAIQKLLEELDLISPLGAPRPVCGALPDLAAE